MMKIGVLGTGGVGQTLAGKLSQVGHEVVVGTRDPAKTLAATKLDMMGNPPFAAWQKTHAKVRLATFADAAGHGQLVVNATAGAHALEVLKAAGADKLRGKVLMDVANPLEFSKGMPPTLLVCNTDSLGEQIQRAFPDAKVVKTLCTLTAALMVDPKAVANGDHTIFVSGNDPVAKAQVTELLTHGFGWKDVVDLGDITTARGQEMMLPMWLRLWGALKTPSFNYKIVRS